jgi:hypothetical protein
MMRTGFANQRTIDIEQHKCIGRRHFFFTIFSTALE